MPVSLRKFGLQLNRRQLSREIQMVGDKSRIGGELKETLDQLDGAILAFILSLTREIYVNGKISKSGWNRVRGKTLNKIHTPYNQFDRRFARVTDKFQKLAFKETSNAMKNTFAKMIPIKRFTMITQKEYRKNLQQLQFMDNKLELEFLKSGREVIEESAYFDEMFRLRHKELLKQTLDGNISTPTKFEEDWFPRRAKQLGWIEEKNIASAATKKSINLGIGTGDINADYRMFLERQLQVGMAPASLITTVTTQHVADMQRILLKAIDEGLDVKVARDRFMKGISKEMLSGSSRRKMEFNAMRIMRTSHQRAATSATSLFGLQNRDIVKELERVANGRPCIACAMLDGTRFPLGSTISDHPMGMAHTNLNNQIVTPNGWKRLGSLHIGDEIMSIDNKVSCITKLKSIDYSGLECLITFKNGATIGVTSEHPFINFKDEEITALKLCQQFLEFKDGFFSCRSIRKTLYSEQNFYYCDCNVIGVEIRRVEHIEVLHIEVEEPHIYFCEEIGLHNCIFVPVMKSLSEMGFDTDTIEEKFGAEVLNQSRSFPTMYSRFFAMSEKDQRLVFGNNKLFDFWKREKFPLQELVVKRNGMFTPTSFTRISARVDELGGVSFPKAKIGKEFSKLSEAETKSFMNAIDPVDRANKDLILVKKADLPKNVKIRSEFLKDGDGFGTGIIEKEKLASEIVSKADGFIRFYPKDAKIAWWDINEYYRTLGVYRRLGVDGKEYFAISKRNFKDLIKKPAAKKPPIKKPTTPLKTKSKADRVMEKFFKGREKEKRFFNDYSLSGYRGINASLRGDIKMTTDIQNKIDILIKGINESPKFTGKVWRGLEFRTKKDVDDFLLSITKGDILESKTFWSSSANSNIAENFAIANENILFEIRGNNGFWMDGASQFSIEQEVLFKPGTKFKIVSRERIVLSKIVSRERIVLSDRKATTKIILEEV